MFKPSCRLLLKPHSLASSRSRNPGTRTSRPQRGPFLRQDMIIIIIITVLLLLFLLLSPFSRLLLLSSLFGFVVVVVVVVEVASQELPGAGFRGDSPPGTLCNSPSGIQCQRGWVPRHFAIRDNYRAEVPRGAGFRGNSPSGIIYYEQIIMEIVYIYIYIYDNNDNNNHNTVWKFRGAGFRGMSLVSGVHKGGFSKGGVSNTNMITTHKLLNPPLLNPPL